MFYNHNVANGLGDPATSDEQENAAQIYQDRLRANLEQIEAAHLLDGMIILQRMEAIGVLGVQARSEQIEPLKIFLEERGLGTVAPNSVSFRAAGEHAVA